MYRVNLLYDEETNNQEGELPPTQTQGTQAVSSQSQYTPVDDDMDPVARLVAMDSDVQSVDCEVDKAIIMGRKKSCSVILDDVTVSATHCRIYYDDKLPIGSLKPELVQKHAALQHEAKVAASPPWTPTKATNPKGEVFLGASHFWVEDLSSNGTFVNMVKLGRGCRARLCHNDVISLCKPETKKRTKGWPGCV